MKMKQVMVTALLLGLLVICASTARAVDGSFNIGASLTEDKPQSKLWYTVHPTTGAVTWWAILGDGTTGIWFYKLVVNGATSSFVKQTFPDGPDAGAVDDAQVDTVVSGRADVLWNDTHLFVLIYKGTTASLSKYTYNNADNPANQTYTRVTGFPITFTLLPTSETATIAQDSTGKLWLAYDPGTDIRVLWSTSADHTVWNTTGMSLGTINNNDDLDAIVAFHNCVGATSNNCIGVLWSDQATDSIRFRIHRDEDIETTWQAVEIAAQGGLIADDHVNVKVTHNGDILAAVKSGTTAPPPGSLDETNLFVRWHDILPPTSPWTVYEVVDRNPNDPNGGSSRPIVMFDQSNQDVYVIYTGRFDSTERTISYKVANLEELVDLGASGETHLIGGQGTGLSINNATSTKQNANNTTGILVLAKGDDAGSTPTLAYYAMIDLTAGTPPPTITSFTATPASITSGQTSTLAWTTTNATSVTINPGGLTGGPSGNVVVSPTTTTTYTLAATGPGGGPVTQTVTVTVTPPPQGADTVNIVHVRYYKSKDLTVAATSNAPGNSVTLTATAIINGVPRTLGKLNYKFGDNEYRTTFKLITPKPTSVTVTSTKGGTDTEVVP